MNVPTLPPMSAPSLHPEIARLVSAFHERTPIRTWSLIVTIYGDAIVPRGGALWLGTLITLTEALRIAPGLVRTAGSRLAADDWLTRNRVGRKSYYRLSARGRDAFAEATERIYHRPKAVWNGRFHVAVLGDAGDLDRSALRKPLEDAGYGLLAPTVMIAPDRADMPGTEVNGAIELEATALSEDDARRLAARVWPLERIAAGYDRFRTQFEPLDRSIAAGTVYTPLESLIARILMIHEFRRIILRDPALPPALLPEEWPGTAARAMSARIYRALVAPSEAWLDEHAVSEDGPLPAPGPAFFERFA